MLVMLVRTKVLAVSQGPEFLGAMAVIDKLLAVIVQTLSLSLPYAAVRFLPERWKADRGEFRRLFVAMRTVILALIIPAMLVSLAITLWWPSLWGAELMPYRSALAVALVGLPVVALLPFLQNAVAGRLQQDRSMGVAFVHAVVMTLAVVGAWKGGMVGYYAAYAVLGAVMIVAVSRSITHDLPAPDQPTAPLGRLGLPASIWRFGGYLFVLTFLAPYAALFVHYRLLAERGAEAAGWMQAAITVGLSVRGVLGSAHSTFLTPNVSAGGTPADRMRWADNFQNLFCVLAGLVVPPVLLFPQLFVRVVYSPTFAPGAAFVLFFVATEVLLLLSRTYQSLLVALDRMRAYVIHNLVAQALVVLVAWWLIRPLGILGAGLSSLVAPIYLLAATMWYLHREYQLRMSARALARTTWLVVTLVGAGILGMNTQQTLFQSLSIKAAAYAVIVLGFYALLTVEERQKAWRFVDRARVRWA